MKKIMVIDEPEIISFVQKIVDDRCEVVWASRDEDVMGCLRKENPNIVLMNYEASECARFGELLQAIRAEKNDIPILLMSGLDVLTHMPVTASGCLIKPFPERALESFLQRFKIIEEKKDF